MLVQFRDQATIPRGGFFPLPTQLTAVALTVYQLLSHVSAAPAPCAKEAPWTYVPLGAAVGSGDALECQEALKNYPATALIHKIADAVGKEGAFCQLPVLPWKERFHESGKGVLDGVRPLDMSAQLMRGVDFLNRPYLALRTETSATSYKKIGAELLFQRYPDPDYENWGSGHLYEQLPLARSNVNSRTIANLRELASGNAIDLGKPGREIIKKLV